MRLDHLLSRETYTEPRVQMSLRSTLWRLTLFSFERFLSKKAKNYRLTVKLLNDKIIFAEIL